ncbi:MAG: flagellar assembly peptidoglycan hydrolase FlgJ [Gammaproteobacteria bacterium]|nr:flagellar assembly peptidoglycan hydrolase FlgJ [Gammaproteobacteria bacterium]MBU1646176.1 flagellar assembly peptidoglycan hydrolase FlgJ [Gammaproteobacteria bacterium]MBU1972238.1 flagellar assembly peptidoglycan hydrolase FlgJ [Gammaproteobacteria bacterium]
MSPNAAVPSVFDLQSLSALKNGVKDADPKALKAAAQQFEALFLQMVLKSMRDATPREGIFDSEQTRMYESLLDQQLAQVMAAKNGTGLAAVIERQLARSAAGPDVLLDEPMGPLPLMPGGQPHSLTPARDAGLPLAPMDRSGGMRLDDAAAVPGAAVIAPTSHRQGGNDTTPPAGASEFVSRVWPHAVEVSRATGIPAHFMVAQAALETGWGKSEPRLADGRPSYNLFGLKAGRSWTGPVAEAQTTEFVDGTPLRQVERFRAYGSYGEAFRDYAGLLLSSPRYAGVVGTQDAASFARGLQQAGYATDPMYAAKLERIIGGNALRVALAG